MHLIYVTFFFLIEIKIETQPGFLMNRVFLFYVLFNNLFKHFYCIFIIIFFLNFVVFYYFLFYNLLHITLVVAFLIILSFFSISMTVMFDNLHSTKKTFHLYSYINFCGSGGIGVCQVWCIFSCQLCGEFFLLFVFAIAFHFSFFVYHFCYFPLTFITLFACKRSRQKQKRKVFLFSFS